jgi:hypothetical protein
MPPAPRHWAGATVAPSPVSPFLLPPGGLGARVGCVAASSTARSVPPLAVPRPLLLLGGMGAWSPLPPGGHALVGGGAWPGCPDHDAPSTAAGNWPAGYPSPRCGGAHQPSGGAMVAPDGFFSSMEGTGCRRKLRACLRANDGNTLVCRLSS